MKGHWITYSAEELVFIEARKELGRRHLHVEYQQRFARPEITMANLKSLCTRKGWGTGRTGCFYKGVAPHNKGVPCEPGKGGLHPNARKTQFRSGNRTGRANQNYKPVGTERVTEDGYIEIKVHDDMPMHSRWQLKHRMEWEAVNGPVPERMALKCIGERGNTDPSNWQLIPRAILPRLNGGRRRQHIAYDTAPEEIKPLLISVAKLEHQVREKSKAAA
jgi:hypothetical protein